MAKSTTDDHTGCEVLSFVISSYSCPCVSGGCQEQAHGVPLGFLSVEMRRVGNEAEAPSPMQTPAPSLLRAASLRSVWVVILLFLWKKKKVLRVKIVFQSLFFFK